jgi:hypothetical protein
MVGIRFGSCAGGRDLVLGLTAVCFGLGWAGACWGQRKLKEGDHFPCVVTHPIGWTELAYPYERLRGLPDAELPTCPGGLGKAITISFK